MKNHVTSRRREDARAGDARLDATQNEEETLPLGQLRRRRIPLVGVVILAISAAIGCQDAARPTRPAWPLPEALSAIGAEKTTVCHAAGRGDNLKFVELALSNAAASAHLDEHGVARAGHEGDYLVTAQTPCPPPPPPGQLVICKQVEAFGLVGQQFEFVVLPGGSYISPPATLSAPGACFAAGTYAVGTTADVIEVVDASWQNLGITTPSISVVPPDRVVPGSLSLNTHRVSVTIGEGMTQVRYVNARPVGSLLICNITPAGFTGAPLFSVQAEWADGLIANPVNIPANECRSPQQVGFGFLVNYPVVVGVVVPAGLRLDAVTVDPPDHLLGTPDLTRRTAADVLIGTGTTKVTFHHVWATP